MLTYSFADLGSVSLYEHLYKCIKTDILKGFLKAGEKLPSKRTFAKNLGISTITVENSYAQLIAEGYIFSIPKKGFFVSDIKKRENENKPAVTMENLRISSGEGSYIADFTSNQTDIENFPFSIWAKLIREILNENRQELVTNPPSGGILPLRMAISKHLKDFRGMEVSPEQIIIGAGTEYLYGLIIQLLGFDKKYGVENPGYDKIARIYKSHQVVCDYIAMDDNGVKIDELEKYGTDVIHISPSHHFPTGMIMPIGRRYELLGWASKSETRYIIEDDYDSEFRLTGQPIPAMQNIDVLEKVIYMNTFTKTLASTVRISYMVLPKPLAEKFYSKLYFYSCTVSNFEQYTLARFINEGYFEKHINRMRNYYHGKRDMILKEIKEKMPDSYSGISQEDSGLHFLIKIDTRLTDQEFIREAFAKGIKIAPLSGYYVNDVEKPEKIFVINYSSVSEENIKKAIGMLYEIK